MLTFLAAFDPGDRVVVPEPAFPAYKNILQALGIEVVRLGLGPATGFAPTVDRLQTIAPPVHGLVIASPANPTGTMLAPEQLAALAASLPRPRHPPDLRRDLPRHHLWRPAASVLAWDRDAVVINGFSKYFCMTGWRLGWLVAPPDLVRPIELLAQNLFISAPALAQEAALSAFACRAELEQRIAGYRRNREALLERLPAAGLDRLAPVDGAFYLYADVGHLTADFAIWCARAARGHRCGAHPGRRFRQRAGHRFVRLAFAGTHERVVAGADRLAAWLGARA